MSDRVMEEGVVLPRALLPGTSAFDRRLNSNEWREGYNDGFLGRKKTPHTQLLGHTFEEYNQYTAGFGEGAAEKAERDLLTSTSEEVRTTSSTGAEKGVKPARYDLIPIPALDQLARLYGKGAEKYAEHNWRKGYEYSKSYAAAMRHMTLFWAGEDMDEEMGLPHVICASFHMFALATFLQEHPEFDDRFVVAEKLKEVQGVITQGVSPGS